MRLVTELFRVVASTKVVMPGPPQPAAVKMAALQNADNSVEDPLFASRRAAATCDCHSISRAPWPTHSRRPSSYWPSGRTPTRPTRFR